jgi:hypothetical protein
MDACLCRGLCEQRAVLMGVTDKCVLLEQSGVTWIGSCDVPPFSVALGFGVRG